MKELKNIIFDKFTYRILLHYFVLLIIYVLVLSVIAFFHFLLDHDLKIIERWIFDKQWVLLFISKIFAFTIFWNYLREDKYKTSGRETIFQTFKSRFFPLRREVMVLITFFPLFFILIGSPITFTQNETYYLKVFTAYLSTIVFYMTDLMIVLMGNIEKKKYSIWNLILMALCFSFFNNLIFLFEGKFDFYLTSNFLICLILGIKSKFNWGGPFVFITLNTAFIDAFFGLDFIWKDSFSLFKLTKDLNTLSIICAYIIGLSYVLFRNRSRFTHRLKRLALN